MCVCSSQASNVSLPIVSPLVIISLFSNCVSVFLFCKQVHLCHFKKIRLHLWAIYYGICLCLTSLSMTISRSIHVAENDIISFLFMAEYSSIVFMYHILFICWCNCRWFPCLSYCKQCFSEHGGACSYSNYGFLQIYAQVVYFLKFYWSKVDLQCCISFRCIAKWFSYIYIYTYIHSFSVYHIGYQIKLFRVPCVMQGILIGYLLYI